MREHLRNGYMGIHINGYIRDPKNVHIRDKLRTNNDLFVIIKNKEEGLLILHNNTKNMNKNFDEFRIFVNEYLNNLHGIILKETFQIHEINLYSRRL